MRIIIVYGIGALVPMSLAITNHKTKFIKNIWHNILFYSLILIWLIAATIMICDTYKAKKDLQDFKQALAPRTITQKQKELIINVLKRYPNTEISLLFVDNMEAKNYAIEFRKIFETASWHLSKFVPVMGGYLPNVILEIPEKEIIPYPFKTLYGIFRENNIDIRYKVTPGVNPPTLIIGEKLN